MVPNNDYSADKNSNAVALATFLSESKITSVLDNVIISPHKNSHTWPQTSLIHSFTNHKGIWWQFAVYRMQGLNKLRTDLILLRAIDIDFFQPSLTPEVLS